MIRFYFHPTPNPAKVALLLEEAGLPYEAIPVDTSKGEQHTPSFRAINPNGKVPAIVDTDEPGGKETRVFDSTAILIYLAEKTGKFLGSPEDRPELLSWLLFLASGLGPFSGQAVHFQFAAPEGLDYAVNRYRREAERHYQVLNDHLEGRTYIVGDTYTIADISAWAGSIAPRGSARVPRIRLAHTRTSRGCSRPSMLGQPSPVPAALARSILQEGQ